MDKTPDFLHPVRWDELLDRVLAIVPHEHHETVMLVAGALAYRDEALEDFLSFQAEPITFQHRGVVAAATSDAAPVDRGGRVDSIVVTATIEASTDTTLRLLNNGVQIGADFVLPASEGLTGYSVDVSDFRTDYIDDGSGLALTIVTPGSGLEGLVAKVRLRG